MKKRKEFEVECLWTYNNLECAIIFNIHCAHRCGYVGVPKGNFFYGKSYDEISDYIDVHGGVTFAGKRDFSKEDLWWIGFDCGHYGDKSDIESMERYMEENGYTEKEMQMLMGTQILLDGEEWDDEKVSIEVECMADQLGMSKLEILKMNLQMGKKLKDACSELK